MYSAKLDGERVTFGTSGLLYQSNKLMYDRKTNTLWRQFTGEPVLGPLADSGIKLTLFAVVVTTWQEWLTAHPDTTVLDIETGVYPASLYRPESDPSSIYHDYFRDPDTMFPVWRRSNLMETKDVVLGLRMEAHVKAYPLKKVLEEGVVNDEIGGTGVVIVTVAESRAARAYQRGDRVFRAASSGATAADGQNIVDQDGVVWDVTEEFLINTEDPGSRLERLPGHMAFWFGWFASFPFTQVYGED